MEKLVLKKNDPTLTKAVAQAGSSAVPAQSTGKNAQAGNSGDEKKPILLGQTRSIKIVDLQVRKRRRNPANCKY